MSADNETYRILGSLETGMVNIEKTLVSINSTLHQAVKDQNAIAARAEKAHDIIMDMHAPLNEAVANGQDWIETKKKAKFIIIGSSVGGGIGGFSLSKVLSGLGALFTP